MRLYLFFAFVLPGILAGETAPVPDCGKFETVCCDGDDTESVPSVGAVVHGCTQCKFPLHSSSNPNQSKNPPLVKERFHHFHQNRVESVIFSSTLTELRFTGSWQN